MVGRNKKQENEKLVNVPVKVHPEVLALIETAAEIENLDVSKLTRQLINAGLEYRQSALKRGGQLAMQLLARFGLLSSSRQYDLLALSDALLSRDEYDKQSNTTAQTAINTPLQPPLNPPERPAIDTISTLLAELRAAEKAPDTEAQAEKAALLRSLIQIVREEEKRMSGNDCANPLENSNPGPSQHPPPKPDPGH